MRSELMLTIKFYLHAIWTSLCLMTIGWLACMIYYDIDPSGLYLYKAIYGTV